MNRQVLLGLKENVQKKVEQKTQLWAVHIEHGS
jgi:hypothetical protein